MVKCKDGGVQRRAEYQVGLPQTDIGSAISPGTEPRLSLSGDLLYISPSSISAWPEISLNLYDSTHDSQIHADGEEQKQRLEVKSREIISFRFLT